MSQYVYNKHNTTRKVLCTVFTDSFLYQKSHSFAALNRSISDTSTTRAQIPYAHTFCEVFYIRHIARHQTKMPPRSLAARLTGLSVYFFKPFLPFNDNLSRQKSTSVALLKLEKNTCFSQFPTIIISCKDKAVPLTGLWAGISCSGKL